MGADSFSNYSDIEDIETAFREQRESAAWEYGHGGYTGTIAEKHEGYVVTPVPDGVPAEEYAERISRTWPAPENDPALAEAIKVYGEKWGPAVALKCDKGWLFIGTASS